MSTSSKLFANPLAPTKSCVISITAFAILVIMVVVLSVSKLLTGASLNVVGTFASIASGQPSPSESKSKWFGIPSLS